MLHIMGLISLHVMQEQTWTSSARGRRTETIEIWRHLLDKGMLVEGRYLNIGLNKRAKPSGS